MKIEMMIKKNLKVKLKIHLKSACVYFTSYSTFLTNKYQLFSKGK